MLYSDWCLFCLLLVSPGLVTCIFKPCPAPCSPFLHPACLFPVSNLTVTLDFGFCLDPVCSACLDEYWFWADSQSLIKEVDVWTLYLSRVPSCFVCGSICSESHKFKAIQLRWTCYCGLSVGVNVNKYGYLSICQSWKERGKHYFDSLYVLYTW